MMFDDERFPKKTESEINQALTAPSAMPNGNGSATHILFIAILPMGPARRPTAVRS